MLLRIVLVFIVATVLTIASSFSQNGFVIKILSNKGENIIGATATLLSNENKTNKQFLTGDQNGIIEVSKTEHFPITIIIDYIGYESQKIVLQNFPENNILEIYLKESTTQLEAAVVTGVGRPTSIDDAVSVYTITTQKDIKAQGAVTLNEAIRNQLGINVGQDQMLGATINMRGLSGNNIKILIDGLPVNGREGGNIDLSQINLSNIERIERVQGPMSVMYGTDALGGAINLITKTNKDSWKIGANTYASTINQYNFGIDGALKINKHNFTLNAGRNFFYGWDDSLKVSETRAPLWRPKELYFANFKYIYTISPTATISYAADYSRDLLVIKSDTTGFADNPFVKKKDTYFYTTRFINRLQAKWKTGKDSYWESNNSYALYHRQRRGWLIDLTTMDKTPSASASDNSLTQFHTYNSRTTYNNKINRFDYTLGYDFNYESISGMERIKDGVKDIGDFALFLSTNIKLHTTLTIQPAFRVIYNTQYNAPFVPAFALRYAPHKLVRIRASYARGFRAPSLKEMFLDFDDSNHKVYGNPDLKAEYGQHFQASGAYTLFDRNKSNGMISVTGFYDDVNNQIMLAINPDAPTPLPGELQEYFYRNISRVRFFSTQVKNEYKFNRITINLGFSFNRNISVTSTLDDGSTYTTPNFNFLEFNANIAYDIPKAGLSFGAYYKHTGRQRILGADIMGGAIFGDYMEAYNIIDGSVEKSFLKDKIILSVGVRNLLNVQRLGIAGGATGGGHSGGASNFVTPGRSFFATLRLQMGSK